MSVTPTPRPTVADRPLFGTSNCRRPDSRWTCCSTRPLGHLPTNQAVGEGCSPTEALHNARTSIERQWPQLAASLAFEPWLLSLRVERVVGPPEGEGGEAQGFTGLPPDDSLSDKAIEQLALEALCLLARSVVTDLCMSRAGGDMGELRAQSRRYWLEGTQLWNAVAPGICPALPDSETVSGRLQLRLLATLRLEGEVDEWQCPAAGAAPARLARRRCVARRNVAP